MRRFISIVCTTGQVNCRIPVRLITVVMQNTLSKGDNANHHIWHRITATCLAALDTNVLLYSKIKTVLQDRK